MFQIREATHADNEALLRLEAESPQGTGISLLIDREDYFYRSRVHDRTRVMLALEREKIVGVMAYALKEALLDGEMRPVAYFYDLRGEATYRRSMKRGLFRLWKVILEQIEEDRAEFIYGHVKADNFDSLNVATRMGAQIAASFNILALPSLAGKVVPFDDHLNQLDEETERIASFVGDRTMRPLDIAAPYRRGAELGYLKGIYRIEEGGSFAQFSLWDLSRIYCTRVLRMPLSLRILGTVLNPLSNTLPLPRVPRVDQKITYLQMFDSICHGPHGKRLMKRLIQQTRRNAHAEGIDILTLFAYADDPLIVLPRFFPQEVLRYHTMVRPVTSDRLPTPPLYIDIRDI